MKRAALISLLLCIVTPSMGVNNANNGMDMTTAVARDQYQQYHPAAVQKPRLLEQFDKRYDDGHYEYSYTLSNGDKRYEHAYWQPVGNNAVLARKGYYSYPTPDNKFLTVFYTSDQNGFQQQLSSYSNSQPNLPRTLDVPQQVHIKPLPVYGVSSSDHSNSPPWHQSQVGMTHVSTTPAPSYVLTNPHQHPHQHPNQHPHQNQHPYQHPHQNPHHYIPTTAAPPYVMASPPNIASHVSNMAGTSSISPTIGEQHPWESHVSHQGNRFKRHADAHQENENEYASPTHSSHKVEGTTSHSNHQKHSTSTPCPTPHISISPTHERSQVAPLSSSLSAGSGNPGIQSHPSSHGSSAGSGLPQQLSTDAEHQQYSHVVPIEVANSEVPYHHHPQHSGHSTHTNQGIHGSQLPTLGSHHPNNQHGHSGVQCHENTHCNWPLIPSSHTNQGVYGSHSGHSTHTNQGIHGSQLPTLGLHHPNNQHGHSVVQCHENTHCNWPLIPSSHTNQGVHGSHTPVLDLNHPYNQNALLSYLASKISAESFESGSSESHERYIPGWTGSKRRAGSGKRRRSGNRPVWCNQSATYANTNSCL